MGLFVFYARGILHDFPGPRSEVPGPNDEVRVANCTVNCGLDF